MSALHSLESECVFPSGSSGDSASSELPCQLRQHPYHKQHAPQSAPEIPPHLCSCLLLEDVGCFGVSISELSSASMWLIICRTSQTRYLPCCLRSTVRIWQKVKGELCLKSPKETGLEKKAYHSITDKWVSKGVPDCLFPQRSFQVVNHLG